MKIILGLTKSGDMIEAYSALKAHTMCAASFTIVFLEDQRLNRRTIDATLDGFDYKLPPPDYVSATAIGEYYVQLVSRINKLRRGDCAICQIIKFRDIWKNTASWNKRGINTVHISDGPPDAFGAVGYRIGFFGSKAVSWFVAPIAPIYSEIHRPSECFFLLRPFLDNPLVTHSRDSILPPVSHEKREIIERATKLRPRVQLVGGFGYDPERMSKYLNIKEFVATSKHSELIVDGTKHALPFHISAEEVFSVVKPLQIVSYPSNSVVWLKKTHPDVPIHCYASSSQNKRFGPLFTFFTKKIFRRIGIQIKLEVGEMIEKSSHYIT